MAAIATLSKDAAILFIPTPALAPHMSAMRKFSMEHGIPAGAYSFPVEDVLFTYSRTREIRGGMCYHLKA